MAVHLDLAFKIALIRLCRARFGMLVCNIDSRRPDPVSIRGSRPVPVLYFLLANGEVWCAAFPAAAYEALRLKNYKQRAEADRARIPGVFKLCPCAESHRVHQ